MLRFFQLFLVMHETHVIFQVPFRFENAVASRARAPEEARDEIKVFLMNVNSMLLHFIFVFEADFADVARGNASFTTETSTLHHSLATTFPGIFRVGINI